MAGWAIDAFGSFDPGVVFRSRGGTGIYRLGDEGSAYALVLGIFLRNWMACW